MRVDSVGVLMWGMAAKKRAESQPGIFRDSLLLMLVLAVSSLQKVDHIEIWALATLIGMGGEE